MLRWTCVRRAWRRIPTQRQAFARHRRSVLGLLRLYRAHKAMNHHHSEAHEEYNGILPLFSFPKGWHPQTEPAILASRIINALSITAMFIINAIPFGDHSVKEISDKYPTYLTPAPYAFSIWGLIYFFLAVFAIYQIRAKSFENELINRGYWLLVPVNALANIGWVYTWVMYGWEEKTLVCSLGFMYLILITLLGIFYMQHWYTLLLLIPTS